MDVEIYYFSGTGNSFALAREIAGKFGGALYAIPAMMDQEYISPQADALGLVFPVYHKGIPLILKRFVDKMVALENRYLFAVCTYGDTPGLALPHLAKLIQARGGSLAAGFGVQMPFNYLTPTLKLKGFLDAFTLREVPVEKQRALLATAPQHVERIVAYVRARKSGDFAITSDFLTRLADHFDLNETLGKSVWLKVAGVTEPTTLSFLESRQLMDRAFHVDEHCIGCGNCARICPVRNIRMVDNAGDSHRKPQWQQRCEQCFACLQWCPQQAIQFGSNTAGRKRYHHPDVKLADMFLFS
ncbi:MAG: EFR1 family ferrodoxin [Anaerolineae bacterium]|nr:EFR1 family ferrodoxin [Anaerolineae bacterium]